VKARELAVIALAVVGIGVASHLAAYQLAWTSTVWDPLFGSGSSDAVLHSRLSDALPVSDAAVGAIAYALEAILATVLAIRPSRRTGLVYALLLAGSGGTAVLLVGAQLAVIHHLCSLCLLSAALSILVAVLGLPGAIDAARQESGSV
jgi:uncharacterized membrane protein